MKYWMCEEFRGVVEKAQFPLKSLFRKTVPETFLHLCSLQVTVLCSHTPFIVTVKLAALCSDRWRETDTATATVSPP